MSYNFIVNTQTKYQYNKMRFSIEAERANTTKVQTDK